MIILKAQNCFKKVNKKRCVYENTFLKGLEKTFQTKKTFFTTENIINIAL